MRKNTAFPTLAILLALFAASCSKATDSPPAVLMVVRARSTNLELFLRHEALPIATASEVRAWISK